MHLTNKRDPGHNGPVESEGSAGAPAGYDLFPPDVVLAAKTIASCEAAIDAMTDGLIDAYSTEIDAIPLSSRAAAVSLVKNLLGSLLNEIP